MQSIALSIQWQQQQKVKLWSEPCCCCHLINSFSSSSCYLPSPYWHAPCPLIHTDIHVCTHIHTHCSVGVNAVDSDVSFTWVYSQIYHLLSMQIQLSYLLSLSLYVFIWKTKIGTMDILNKCKILTYWEFYSQ